MVKFLDLNSQYQSIKSEIDDVIASVINESAFIGGEYVAKFETEFADYVHAKHCIGVANGTDGLEVAIEALNLPPGSEIIVPANSFIASAEAVTRSGHKLVFADVDRESYVLDAEDVSKRISPDTKAIMAVHLYGHPCDMDPLLELAKHHDVKIIEDCAQAHGAEYKGQRVGSIGDIASFSFYPGKNLGAYGDGGAITTNDNNLATKCRMIANHGRLSKYNHELVGRNSRLDGLQAAILSVKLKHLDKWTEQRIRVADAYTAHLKECKNVTLPVRKEWAKQVYHLFVIRVNYRDDLKQYLTENNIQTGIHYPIALPKLQAFKHLRKAEESMFAIKDDSKLLSLPIGEHIGMRDVESVVKNINNFF